MKRNYTVIEISYEVANKIGGIYTVLVSKIGEMERNIRDYYLMGPYYKDKSKAEFEEIEVPKNLAKIFSKIKRSYGIKCYYGRWLTEHKPFAILIDFDSIRPKLNSIKKEMWDNFRIDSLHSDSWFDEPLLWGKAAGIVLEQLIKEKIFKNKLILHFHEWISGAGLLHLKEKKMKVPTVFTTHSTVLGRTIAEVGGKDIYGMIEESLKNKESIPNNIAYDYQCQAKHLLEKTTAMNATFFTVVSETLYKESTAVLGRKPDFILPNGLNMSKFPLMETLSNMHVTYRNRIWRFLISYFTPYYNIDTKNSIIFYMSGRNEFHNKGIDVFIDSLGELNKKIKAANSSKTAFVFVWIPENTKERKRTVMEHLALFDTVEEVVRDEIRKIEEKIIDAFSKGIPLEKANIFDNEFLYDIRKMELKLKQNDTKNPPISPYELYSENAILKNLAKNGLLNREEDRVKVIYYPVYLSPADGLLGLNYYHAIIGCHVGVFPSYYESWGYTPLEAAALGLQSITTDLSGFGKFIKPQLQSNDTNIVVIPRENQEYHDVVENLSNTMYKIYSMSKKERGAEKIKAKQLSILADWKYLIKNYLDVYDASQKI